MENTAMQLTFDFTTLLIEALKAAFEEAKRPIKITSSYTEKTNETVETLVLQRQEENAKYVISPTIYPRDYEQAYKNGMPIEEIVQKIFIQVNIAYENAPELPEFTQEEAEKRIRLVLINKEQNRPIIEKTAHHDVGDTGITAIPRWFLDSGEASFVVNDDVARSLNLTQQEILDIAYKNTQSESFKVRTMEEVMADVMGPEFSTIMPPSEEPHMIVISNNQGLYGAAGIINESAMEQVAQRFGSTEFLIIPSSIHEAIAIRADNADLDAVKEMIMSVNSSEVSKQEYLSDEPIRYSNGKLELAIQPKMEQKLEQDEQKIEMKHKMRM